jgi:hypothetical protein
VFTQTGQRYGSVARLAARLRQVGHDPHSHYFSYS